VELLETSHISKKSCLREALVVYESEPHDNLEFLQLTNPMVTPHICGNAEKAILAVGRPGTKHLKDYFIGNKTI